MAAVTLARLSDVGVTPSMLRGPPDPDHGGSRDNERRDCGDNALLHAVPRQQVGTYRGRRGPVSAFTEKSITLATLTAGLPYDVFIVDSTLALELLAWTNGTTARPP